MTGIEVTDQSFTLNDVLAGIASGQSSTITKQAIQPASADWGALHVLPADRLLASRNEDVSLGREARLKTALESVRESYGHVVIDCPPSLGMLTTNALVATDTALIVSTPRESSIDGVAQMVSTISTIKTHCNSSLTLAGVFLNLFRPDRTDRCHRKNTRDEIYGKYAIPNFLPEKKAIARGGTNHHPITTVDQTVSDVFTSLVNHILQEAS